MAVEVERTCTKCLTAKNISCFAKNPRYADGRLRQCRKCVYQAAYARLKKNPQRIKAYRKQSHIAQRAKRGKIGDLKARLKYRFGISIEQFEEMRKQQGNACRICRTLFGRERMTSPRIDHCHNSFKVRGLLCTFCNTALGMFRDDSTLLRKASDYLDEAEKRNG